MVPSAKAERCKPVPKLPEHGLLGKDYRREVSGSELRQPREHMLSSHA